MMQEHTPPGTADRLGASIFVLEDQSSAAVLVKGAMPDEVQDVAILPSQILPESLDRGRCQPAQMDDPILNKWIEGFLEIAPLLLYIEKPQVDRTRNHGQHVDRRLHLERAYLVEHAERPDDGCLARMGQKRVIGRVAEVLPGHAHQAAAQPKAQAQPLARGLRAGQAFSPTRVQSAGKNRLEQSLSLIGGHLPALGEEVGREGELEKMLRRAGG
jgi:hypothetical protein